jgi:diguanylate cyclase (GGDEF)-like protein/PAS domain S-box-containing protein
VNPTELPDSASDQLSVSLALQPILSDLGVGVVVFDAVGAVVESNQRAKEMVTIQPGVFASIDRADDVFEMFDIDGHPVSRDQLPVMRALKSGESVINTVMGFGERGDARGEVIWMLIGTHVVRDDADEVVNLITTFLDVTAQRAAQTALLDSERRFRLLAENAADMIFRVRVSPDFGFDYVNPAARTLLGYDPDEFYADYELALRLMHPDDRLNVRAVLGSVVTDGAEEIEPIIVRMLRRDGSTIWTEYQVVPIVEGRTVVALEGIVRDVTVRMTKEADLSYQALHDPLTGLANRASLLEALERALGTTRASDDDALAVLYIDLDRFKTVNDNLGHEIGDRVLSTVAVRISDAMRPSDTVARLGGDEFAAVLANLSDTAEAVAVAERLLGAISSPMSFDGSELVGTASVGIAFSSTGEETPSELLRRADVAMYTAKDRGRARIEQYEAGDSAPRLDPSHG